MKLQNETKIRSTVHGRWYDDACGTAFGMELIGERWSLLIVRELMFGPLRFSMLRSNLPGISAKVLTERLETLEAAKVLVKRALPPPSNAQGYELTEWGYAVEPLIQELGRWAAKSPLHNPTLPLSPTSFMLSLRTMLNAKKADDWHIRIGFRFPEANFVAELAHGQMSVSRTDPKNCEVIFVARDGPSLAAMFYAEVAADKVGVRIDGDIAVAKRFMNLFELPDKTG